MALSASFVPPERPVAPTADLAFAEGGIREFVRYLNRSKAAVHETIFWFRGERDGMGVELALQCARQPRILVAERTGRRARCGLRRDAADPAVRTKNLTPQRRQCRSPC